MRTGHPAGKARPAPETSGRRTRPLGPAQRPARRPVPVIDPSARYPRGSQGMRSRPRCHHARRPEPRAIGVAAAVSVSTLPAGPDITSFTDTSAKLRGRAGHRRGARGAAGRDAACGSTGRQRAASGGCRVSTDLHGGQVVLRRLGGDTEDPDGSEAESCIRGPLRADAAEGDQVLVTSAPSRYVGAGRLHRCGAQPRRRMAHFVAIPASSPRELTAIADAGDGVSGLGGLFRWADRRLEHRQRLSQVGKPSSSGLTASGWGSPVIVARAVATACRSALM